MIAYRISRADLGRSIESHCPGWLDRARKRTAQISKRGRYLETQSIWSEIKPVYMTLQGESKCAFCERKLESLEYGKGEQAVEHFRPKGGIKRWKASAALAAEGVVVSEPPSKRGYHLLAYDIFNYSAACYPCNSALKGKYFPIAGRHNTRAAHPEDLLNEQPFLIYPIGDFDVEPEALIRFHGLSPQAAVGSGHRRRRALVTIEFFQLDSPSRQNLMRERAMVITNLYQALATLDHPAREADEVRAGQIVTGLTASNSAHTNCARCFHRLFQTDKAEAREIADRAAEFVASKS